MNLLSCSATNFGSYEHLDFDFSEGGLHLVFGATGSGKSTLCDVAPWVLFGRTAKNGPVSDVLAWNASEDTEVRISVEIYGQTVTVTRRRGRVNDLYFDISGTLVRGKDISDTQRLLDRVLGVTAEQYLMSAYYHELSPIANFFTATAKVRRQITEGLVDLTVVSKVQERCAAEIKENSNSLISLEKTSSSLVAKHSAISSALSVANRRSSEWATERTTKLQHLKDKSDRFAMDIAAEEASIRERLEAWNIAKRDKIDTMASALSVLESKKDDLEDIISALEAERASMEHLRVCKECGAKLDSTKIEAIDADLKTARDNLTKHLVVVAAANQNLAHTKRQVNPMLVELDFLPTDNPFSLMIDTLEKEKNPHKETVKTSTGQLLEIDAEIKKTQATMSEIVDRGGLLSVLKDMTAVVRQACIETTIYDIQTETNRLLATYFAAIIRIEFRAGTFDKLDVTVFKDGNECSYTQLSKGQRQLLRLCFVVACINTSAKYSGIMFEQLFFDEALDGLDDSLKIASFGLLKELADSRQSVFVVEHSSDFKNMFNSRYEVSLTGSSSTVTKVL